MKIKHALIHNTGWKIIAMLFNFINNILIVRILGVEASANFFYVVAILTFFSTVLRVGLENGIVYFISKRPEKEKAIVWLLFFVLTIQTIVTIICLRFFVKELVGYSFFWCVVFIMSNVLVYYVSAFYQVKRMYKSLNISGCIMVLCQTLFLGFLHFTDANILFNNILAKNKSNSILIISGAAILFQMMFLCYFFYDIYKSDLSLQVKQKGIAKELFGFSLLNFGITVLFFLTLRADLYFIEKFCSKAVLGNYVQASKIGQMLLVFPGLIAGVIFPYTINEAGVLARKVAVLCRLLTLFFFVGFIAFIILGPSIFIWLLGKDFNLSYHIFNASFLGVYFLSVNLLLVAFFEGINNQLIIIYTFVATFLIIAVADYFLVPAYGYLSAAWIFSVANFIGSLILLKTFIAKTGVKMKEIFLFQFSDVKLLNFK